MVQRVEQELSGPDVTRMAASLIKRSHAFLVVAMENEESGGFVFAANTLNMTNPEDGRHAFMTKLCADTFELVNRLNKNLEEIARVNRENKKVEEAKRKRSDELSKNTIKIKNFESSGPLVGNETLIGFLKDEDVSEVTDNDIS